LILVAAALAIAGARMAWLLGNMNVNVPAFTAVVLKLLMSGNQDRARKICNATPRVPLAIGVRLMLESVDGVDDDAELRRRLGPVWLKQVLGLRPTLRRFDQATRLVLGLAGAGVVLSLFGGGGLHPMILGPVVATAVVAAATEFKLRQVEAATLESWERVLDFLARGLRDEVIAEYERKGLDVN